MYLIARLLYHSESGTTDSMSERQDIIMFGMIRQGLLQLMDQARVLKSEEPWYTEGRAVNYGEHNASEEEVVGKQMPPLPLRGFSRCPRCHCGDLNAFLFMSDPP